MNSPLSAEEARAILWADGVAPRKRQIAPSVSNQRWPALTQMAQATLIEQTVRLQVLEELIYSSSVLYAKDIKLAYERKVKEAANVDGR